MDKQDVYNQIVHDLDNPLSLSTSLRVWREEFPEVRIPAQQRLYKCEECKLCHEQVLATKDHTVRKTFKLRRQELHHHHHLPSLCRHPREKSPLWKTKLILFCANQHIHILFLVILTNHHTLHGTLYFGNMTIVDTFEKGKVAQYNFFDGLVCGNRSFVVGEALTVNAKTTKAVYSLGFINTVHKCWTFAGEQYFTAKRETKRLLCPKLIASAGRSKYGCS